MKTKMMRSLMEVKLGTRTFKNWSLNAKVLPMMKVHTPLNVLGSIHESRHTSSQRLPPETQNVNPYIINSKSAFFMAAKVQIEYNLSDEAKELAKVELRETPDVVADAIKQLRGMIEADTTLNYRTDDEFLTIFLRPCKYYPESAFKSMKKIADFRKKYANVLCDLDADAEKTALVDHRVVNVLANRDQKGRRVLIANIGGAWDTKAISGDQIFRLFYLIHLAAIQEPETQVRGSVVILDFKGLSMKQVAQLTPNFSLRLLSFIQEAMPLRLKEVHIVKQPFIFNVVWNVFKPFIGEKLNKRLWFHGSDNKSLHKYLSPDFLPEDYGGKLPQIDYSSADWYPLLKTLDDKIGEWKKFGYKS